MSTMPKESPTTRRRSKRGAKSEPIARERTGSKFEEIVALLVRPEGASIAELAAATGWQPHSVRGALAGSLKRKGHVIRSEKHEGVRRYRIGAPQ
jgi:hypothetical protein